jgi:hypothetical protein
MKRHQKHLLRLIYTIPLLILIGGSISIYLQLRQANLNQGLISAIRKRDTTKAMSLLEQGASARAVDTSGAPATINGMARELWGKVRGRGRTHRFGGTPA